MIISADFYGDGKSLVKIFGTLFSRAEQAELKIGIGSQLRYVSQETWNLLLVGQEFKGQPELSINLSFLCLPLRQLFGLCARSYDFPFNF